MAGEPGAPDDAGAAVVRSGQVGDEAGFRRAFESVAAEGCWIGWELPVDWDARRPWRELVEDADGGCFVAVAPAGEVVGWCVAHLVHGRAELGMGIVDGHRGGGLGRRLLDAGVRWAVDAGAHKVVLELWPHNERARRLYERAGFVLEGRHRRHWRRRDGSLWDSLTMGLVLDETSPGRQDADGPG